MSWRDQVFTGERRRQVEASGLISAKVAGALLGVTANRVRQMVKEGLVAGVLVDDGYCGQFIFQRAVIERLAANRREFQTLTAAERRPSRWGKAHRHQPSYQRACERHGVQESRP